MSQTDHGKTCGVRLVTEVLQVNITWVVVDYQNEGVTYPVSGEDIDGERRVVPAAISSYSTVTE